MVQAFVSGLGYHGFGIETFREEPNLEDVA
jgi:hypothetical protein